MCGERYSINPIIAVFFASRTLCTTSFFWTDFAHIMMSRKWSASFLARVLEVFPELGLPFLSKEFGEVWLFIKYQCHNTKKVAKYLMRRQQFSSAVNSAVCQVNCWFEKQGVWDEQNDGLINCSQNQFASTNWKLICKLTGCKHSWHDSLLLIPNSDCVTIIVELLGFQRFRKQFFLLLTQLFELQLYHFRLCW